MTAPVARFYFAPGYTWKTPDADIVWVEITDKVLLKSGGSTRRGRSSELDDMRTGTGSVTLKNADRTFDPTYAPGPYFGDLKPGVPFKIEGEADGDTHSVLRGFIDGWPQDYDLGNTFATVDIDVIDGFGKLSAAGSPSSVYAHEVASDDPVAYWKLDEGSGNLMGDSSGNGAHGRYDNPDLGQDPLVTGGVAAVTFAHDGDHRGIVNPKPLLTGYPFTLEAWVQFTRVATNYSAILWGAVDQGLGLRVQMDCPNSAHPSNNTAGALMAANYARAVKGTTPIGDGFPHHVVAEFVNTTTINLYVDGEAESISTWSAGGGMSQAYLQRTRVWSVGNLPDSTAGDFGLGGTIDEVAVYRSALGGTRVAAHYTAGTAPWDGDLPGDRVDRLLDLAGWPADLRDLEPGWTVLGPATIGDNILALLKRTEAAEQGRFFISKDGKATLLHRYHSQLETVGLVPQAVFSDDGSDVRFSRLSFDYDTRLVKNRVRASRSGGAAIEVLDQASIDTYGEQVDTDLRGIDVPSDAVAQSAAEYRLDRYREPQLRVRPITVPLHALSAAEQSVLLGLELGHRVTVERTPQGVGSAITQDTLVEGISHSLEGDAWSVTFTLSPVDTRTYALWDEAEWGDGLWGY